MWEAEVSSDCISAQMYILNASPKLAKSCGLQEFMKANTPFAEDYHPELDESDFLPPERITTYKSLLRSANWIITLGRFDIAFAVNALSRYSMAPRQGHLYALQRVFGYLKHKYHAKLLIDIGIPPIQDKMDLGEV